ncbi:MAG: diacylglycerol kinase family lipid kinase [Lachnospiraceae bacterium]|nr:diacylglycerol kinase family lipid kinase [Lachnospiraceae bacterium]
MNKKMMLIVNPVAGRGGYSLNFGEAMRVFSYGGYAVTLYFTKGKNDAARFAEENGAQYDIVTCVGGDGTLSEVLSGLMKINNPPPVGYIPMGTANDVATTLHIPKNDTVGAANLILNGEPHPYDVGGFGDDGYFAYIAGFGAFTNVSYSTPQDQKNMLGHLAYVLQGMAELPNIETIRTRVEFDDGVIETDLVYGSMSNSTSVAGIVKLKENMVSLGDGYSELVLVKDPRDVNGFGEIISSVLSGRFDGDKLIILHTKKAKFSFDHPVAWTRDGEEGGKHQKITLVNYHRPVQLIF